MESLMKGTTNTCISQNVFIKHFIAVTRPSHAAKQYFITSEIIGQGDLICIINIVMMTIS